MPKHHRSSAKNEYMQIKRSILERYLVNNPIAVNVAPESLLLSDLYQFLKENNYTKRPLNQLQTITRSWIYDPDAAGIEPDLLLNFIRSPSHYGACNMDWFESNKTEFLTAPFSIWNEYDSGDGFKVGEKYISDNVHIVKGKNDAFAQSLMDMYRKNNNKMFDELKKKYGKISIGDSDITIGHNDIDIPVYDPYGVPMGRTIMTAFPMIYDEFLSALGDPTCKLDPNAACQYIAGASAYLTKVSTADCKELENYLTQVNNETSEKLIGGGNDLCKRVYTDVRNFQTKLYSHFHSKKHDQLKKCIDIEQVRLKVMLSSHKLSSDDMTYIYHYVHYFMNYVASVPDSTNAIHTGKKDENMFDDDPNVQTFIKTLLADVAKKTSDNEFTVKIAELKTQKQLVRLILEQNIGNYEFYELNLDVDDGEKTGKVTFKGDTGDVIGNSQKYSLKNISTGLSTEMFLHPFGSSSYYILSGISFMQKIYGDYLKTKVPAVPDWQKKIDCIGMTFDFIILKNTNLGNPKTSIYGVRCK